MATRAQQSDFLLAGIAINSTGLAASGWWISFHEAGNSIGNAGALTNTKNAYNDKDKTGAITVKELNTYGAAQVYMDGVYKIAVWDDTGDPSSDVNAVLKFEYDFAKYDFGVGGTVTKTGDYTATTDDALVLVDTSGGDVTITLPLASTATNPISIKKISSDSNTVIVATQGGDQIDDSSSSSFASPYFTLQATSDGSNWWGTASLTDAATLAGFSPSQTAAASSVVVSQGDGKIDGSWVDVNDFDGDGLGTSGNELKVNVDDSSIEITTDALNVKAGGITNDMMARTSYTASATGYMVGIMAGTASAATGTYVKVAEGVVPTSGTLYSQFLGYQNDSASRARVYVNGAAVGTDHSLAFQDWDLNTDASITVAKDDLIQLYVKADTDAGDIAAVSGWVLRSSTGDAFSFGIASIFAKHSVTEP